MSDVDYCPSCGEVLLTRTEFREDLVLNVYRTEFRCGKCKFHGEVFRISPPEDTTTDHIGVQTFIEELNDLQQKYGLRVNSDPKGLAVYDLSDTRNDNRGRRVPIGYLVRKSTDDAGTFKTELWTRD